MDFLSMCMYTSNANAHTLLLSLVPFLYIYPLVFMNREKGSQIPATFTRKKSSTRLVYVILLGLIEKEPYSLQERITK